MLIHGNQDWSLSQREHTITLLDDQRLCIGTDLALALLASICGIGFHSWWRSVHRASSRVSCASCGFLSVAHERGARDPGSIASFYAGIWKQQSGFDEAWNVGRPRHSSTFVRASNDFYVSIPHDCCSLCHQLSDFASSCCQAPRPVQEQWWYPEKCYPGEYGRTALEYRNRYR